MFLSSWSIALTISSLIVLALLGIATRTGIRVLLFWDPARDDNKQIRLENEIWLSSTLVEYALGFQIITLILLVLAADSYGQVIVGAMCATGAFLANDYGTPSLLVKLAGVFLYGFWIVLHQLDIRAETYPLVRAKYVYLLFLLVFVLVDFFLQTSYIAGIKPDIITSCCAVVFGSAQGDGCNFVGAISQDTMLLVFYLSAAFLFCTEFVSYFWYRVWLEIAVALEWLYFFGVAIWAIITVISSYVYAMPYHRCPFCLLKPEYNYVGFIIYSTLIVATFFGIVPALLALLRRKKDLAEVVIGLQKNSKRIALVFLVVFLLTSSYHLLVYMIMGGEA